MIPRRILAWLAIAAAVAGCRAEPASNVSQPPPTPTSPATSPAGMEVVPLTIQSGERNHRFMVEVARTDEQQERGLMFRERLGADQGMIFPFAFPRPASFWMRNTLIPLDMIFIREDGTIARVAANTVPLSEETVTSGGELVVAVLELRGGRSAELGIRAGDRVSWPR